MDHAVRLGDAAAQAFEVFERATMHLRTGGAERLCPRLGAGQTKNLVARGQQLRNNRRADKTSGAGNKNTHEQNLLIC